MYGSKHQLLLLVVNVLHVVIDRKEGCLTHLWQKFHTRYLFKGAQKLGMTLKQYGHVIIDQVIAWTSFWSRAMLAQGEYN